MSRGCVFREEFDDWAVLLDPDEGHGFGLNPAGICLRKRFDAQHSIDEILTALCRHTLYVPENASHDVGAFVDAPVAEGLAAFDTTPPEKSSPSHAGEVAPFAYGPPQLINLS